MLRSSAHAIIARMWTVTTVGELPDDYEQREHAASATAGTTTPAAYSSSRSTASRGRAKKPTSTGVDGHASFLAARSASASRSSAPHLLSCGEAGTERRDARPPRSAPVQDGRRRRLTWQSDRVERGSPRIRRGTCSTWRWNWFRSYARLGS